jgi:hypothetical protein
MSVFTNPKMACRTCSLPESAHETLRDGTVRLRAFARARVGDTLPPVCWGREMGQGDLNFRKAFQRRVLAPKRVRQVYGRQVA